MARAEVGSASRAALRAAALARSADRLRDCSVCSAARWRACSAEHLAARSAKREDSGEVSVVGKMALGVGGVFIVWGLRFFSLWKVLGIVDGGWR